MVNPVDFIVDFPLIFSKKYIMLITCQCTGNQLFFD